MQTADGTRDRGYKAYKMKMRIATAAVVITCMVLLITPNAFSGDEVLIGLIPEDNIFQQMDRYRPLAAYLSERLGVKVRFTILSRYGDVVDRFLSRKMDGAFFGVFTGVLAMEKLGAEPIVRAKHPDGTSTVQSYIFVRSDSGIRTVSDMRGKRIVFVDRATATGYLFALAFLRQNSVAHPGLYFKEISFTGSHGSVIYSVLDNRADIGTAKSTIFEMFIRKDPTIRNELKIIATSPDLPDTTLFLRKDFPEPLRTRLRELLLSLDKDPEGRKVLQRFESSGFMEAGKKDFEPFYSLARQTEIKVKNYRYR